MAEDYAGRHSEKEYTHRLYVYVKRHYYHDRNYRLTASYATTAINTLTMSLLCPATAKQNASKKRY
ncbi:MAG: hypothetical protein ACI9B9_001452 [Halioglobus sp.]|jgi:hypothetical protein